MLDLNNRGRPLSVGSLFSGYGGLDLAVEYALDAETVWFSENNQHVARIFAHHWPDAPNLGDITTIDWNDVPRVDVLCGGFPCLNVKVGSGSTGCGRTRGVAHIGRRAQWLRSPWRLSGAG